MNSVQKRFIGLVLVILAVTGVIIGIYSYINSFQDLRIDFAGNHAGLKASLYKVPFDGPETNHDVHIKPENLVREFDQDSDFHLKKGEYLLATRSNGTLMEESTTFELREEKVKKTISAKLSEVSLRKQLAQEKESIHNTIRAAFPGVINTYRIAEGKLYENGEWYGTTISLPQPLDDSGYVDIYRIILYKKNNSWEIQTHPPELIFSYKKYPNIPRNVISDVNAQE